MTPSQSAWPCIEQFNEEIRTALDDVHRKTKWGAINDNNASDEFSRRSSEAHLRLRTALDNVLSDVIIETARKILASPRRRGSELASGALDSLIAQAIKRGEESIPFLTECLKAGNRSCNGGTQPLRLLTINELSAAAREGLLGNVQDKFAPLLLHFGDDLPYQNGDKFISWLGGTAAPYFALLLDDALNVRCDSEGHYVHLAGQAGIVFSAGRLAECQAEPRPVIARPLERRLVAAVKGKKLNKNDLREVWAVLTKATEKPHLYDRFAGRELEAATDEQRKAILRGITRAVVDLPRATDAAIALSKTTDKEFIFFHAGYFIARQMGERALSVIAGLPENAPVAARTKRDIISLLEDPRGCEHLMRGRVSTVGKSGHGRRSDT